MKQLHITKLCSHLNTLYSLLERVTLHLNIKRMNGITFIQFEKIIIVVVMQLHRLDNTWMILSSKDLHSRFFHIFSCLSLWFAIFASKN